MAAKETAARLEGELQACAAGGVGWQAEGQSMLRHREAAARPIARASILKSSLTY
jgi:hypothetical protein